MPMRAVIQRVLEAQVQVEGRIAGKIQKGMLVYLSVAKDDDFGDAEFIAKKLVNLRIFQDARRKMNLSLDDVAGQILLISNFTLHGDCRKGRRPGFDNAAGPQKAEELYERTAELIQTCGINVEKGIFAAHMHVQSINDGPVTFLLDSKKLF